MSAFEQLERQLFESVEERSRVRGLERLPLLWRGRLGQRTLVLAVSLITAAAAAGLLAGGDAHRPSPQARISANAGEPSCAPCQAFVGHVHSGVSDTPGLSGSVGAPGFQARDRRGLSVVRWSQEELSVTPEPSPDSAG